MIGAFCSSLFYIIRNCVLCYFFKTLYFLIGNFSFRKSRSTSSLTMAFGKQKRLVGRIKQVDAGCCLP